MKRAFITILMRKYFLIPSQRIASSGTVKWSGGGNGGGQGMILQINYSTPSSNSSSSSASETSSSSFFSSFSVLISGRQAGWNILRLLVQVVGTTFLNGRIIVPGLAASYAFEFKRMKLVENYPIDRLYCFCCCPISQQEQLYILYNISTYSQDLIYILSQYISLLSENL